jgi:hypothetical protein
MTGYIKLVQERTAYVGIGHVRSRYSMLVLLVQVSTCWSGLVHVISA